MNHNIKNKFNWQGITLPGIFGPITSSPTIPYNISPSGTGDYCEKNKKNKRDPDGCFCISCKEFSPYAEPNLDHDRFICYSCRTYPVFYGKK